MAKVIGYDLTATKRCTCPSCSAIVEYTQSDTFDHKYGYDYLGDYSVTKAIHCPNCGAVIHVR